MVFALGQTVTVINRSGKVVSNSKHLVNIYKEAKSAYRERKAELNAARSSELEEKRTRHALRDMSLDDGRSHTSSRHTRDRDHPRRAKSHRHPHRPPVERGFTDSFYENDAEGRERHHRRPSRLRFEQDLHDPDVERGEMIRRHSDGPADVYRGRATRSSSEPHIDMDLAYGDLPPPLPASRQEEEKELRSKMSGLTRLLDEANCLQHSVTATIESLQKNPDALAAVALTLAEISNLAGRMGPTTITAMKGSFPAVMALLSSPQFMIAAGVGVGITVVALGGYKIIKRIKQEKLEKQRTAMSHGSSFGELKEMPPDVEVDRIEHWRRGIADVQADSIGTSVDGELITPGAERMLIDQGVLREGDAKSTRTSKHRKSSSKSKTAKTAKTAKSTKSTKSTQSHSTRGGEKVKVRRTKEPSRLRMFFD